MKKLFYIFLFTFLLASPMIIMANTTDIEVLDQDVFDFSIATDNDRVDIVWENVPDNTSEITIERSYDGKRYTSVYRTNSISGYDWQDDLFSLPIEDVYYRFKFTLKDNSEVFSNAKFVSLKNQDHIQPNIFSNGGQVLFDFYSTSDGIIKAQIFNSTANLVNEEVFEVDRGDNNHEISLFGVRSGLYFLRLELNGKTTTTKFFVR